MKLTCLCGHLVPDTELTKKYKWIATQDWNRLLETMEQAIEGIEDDSMKEAAIMKILYADKTRGIWECPKCHRLMTIKDGEVVHFRRESRGAE